MMDNKKVRGYGFFEVNGVRSYFENAVSPTFDSAINHYLARLGLTDESIIPTANTLMSTTANGFSLIGDTPDPLNFKLYNEIGYLPMSSFEVQGVEFNKIRLRGAAISASNGTVRGGGFNVITKNRKSPLTSVPFLRRKITIPVTTFYSIVSNAGWIYHYANKAFYYFQTAGTVTKIPWDYETGLWGTQVNTTTGFTYSSSQMNDIFTDGENRLFAIASTSSMRIYDFTTDTFSTVTLSSNLSGVSSVANFLSWDNVVGGLRCVQTGRLSTTSNGFVIYPDGTVSLNTGTLPLPSNSWNPVLYESDIIWSYSSSVSVSLSSVIPADDVNYNPVGSLSSQYSDINADTTTIKLRYTPRDSNDNFLYVDFNNTTPTEATLHFCRKPINYFTIMSATPVSVDIGDSLVIEYTFQSGI